MPDEQDSPDTVEHAMQTASRLCAYSDDELIQELARRHEASVFVTVDKSEVAWQFFGSTWLCRGAALAFMESTRRERGR